MLSELLSDLRYRLRALFRRADVEAELDEELRFHLEREAQKHEARGLSPAEATRRARLAFGGVDRAKEASRDARGTILLETLWQDVRYAARSLRRTPTFTAGVVVALGLGIGANAAMFGIVDQLLLRPPAYLHEAGRVHRVYVSSTWERQRSTELTLQFPRYADFTKWTHAFSTVAAFATWTVPVGDGDAARNLRVTAATANYFALFDAVPVAGRFFSSEETGVPSGAPVAVLGYDYWQSAYGGRADALGRQIRVGHTLYTIIGVAPVDFSGMPDQGDPAMYLPITTFAFDLWPGEYANNYDRSWLEVVVRRRPGVGLTAATADLTAALQRSWLAYAATKGIPSLASAQPATTLGPVQLGRGPMAGPEARVLAWVSGVALIVFLIACANVANLLLARALTRHREIALRRALGVSRSRLLRQLLTESLLLAFLGGGAGLAAAQWGGALLRALFLPGQAAAGPLTDGRTLLAALATTLLAAVLTGVAPAVQAVRADLAHVLNAGSRDVGGRSARGRAALLLFQATVSVVLLVGAGLFVRSLQRVRALRLGYDLDPVLVLSEEMRGVALAKPERMALEKRLVEAARATPGVTHASVATSVPFWGFSGRRLYVAGVDSLGALGDFILQAANPDYFQTMGTRIVRGRGFDDRDRANAPRVTVVSEGMARVLWPGLNPLGQCVRIDVETAPCTTVVGVAEDLHIRNLRNEHEYTYYLPIDQFGEPTGTQLVRVAGDAAKYADAVRRSLQRVMPGAAFVTAAPLREMVDPKMQSWRSGATMFVAFGGLALALAGIGLYSMIAYGVAQRRREIGVRIALGASRTHVVQLVVGGGVRLVVAGLALGTVIALVAGRWAASLLFRESPTDPVIYGVVAAVLVSVAVVASALPALAASRVDPNIALRSD